MLRVLILTLCLGVLGLASSAKATVPCLDSRGCPDLTTSALQRAENGSGPHRDFPDWEFFTETFAETDCAVVEGEVVAGTRHLLRFNAQFPNVGRGALIVGNPADHPEWFTFAPCHNHYHFTDYADYRLWTPEGWSAWSALRQANPDTTAAALLAANPSLAPVAGHKQGFCVIDVVKMKGNTPKTYQDCATNQGLSVGWADFYSMFLDGQWIDVTGISGPHVLEIEVNAERLFTEEDYRNNSTSKAITVP